MIKDVINTLSKTFSGITPIDEERGLYDVYGHKVLVGEVLYKSFYFYKAMRSKRINLRPMIDSYSKILGRDFENEK
jgi:hypothetical protein